MFRKVILAMFALVLCGIAAAETAPTVDELVSRNIAARGGIDKIKGVQTMKISAKAIVMNGMELPMTIYVKRPAFMRVETSIQGKTMVQAFDGAEGWSINPMTGSDDPKKSGADETKTMRDNAAESLDGPLVDYKDKGIKLESMGKEDVEGSPAYKLRITKKDGGVSYDWLDAETYLDVKTSSKTTQMGQEMQVESYSSGYKPEGGVMIPHKMDQRINGQSMMKMSLDSVAVNAPLDNSLFTFPAPKPDDKPAEKK